jgi:hypothetical protein
MRSLLFVGLLLVVGCAGPSRSRTIEWGLVGVHPNNTPEPALTDGQLLISGRAVRTKNLYAAPVTLECGLQSENTTSNNSFFIDFVPVDSPIVDLAQHYLSIRLSDGQSLVEVGESNLEQPVRLIKSALVPIEAEGRYKLVVEVHGSNLVVHVNGRTLQVDQPVPYDKFSIELRTFPPPSSWRVLNLTVH